MQVAAVKLQRLTKIFLVPAARLPPKAQDLALQLLAAAARQLQHLAVALVLSLSIWHPTAILQQHLLTLPMSLLPAKSHSATLQTLTQARMLPLRSKALLQAALQPEHLRTMAQTMAAATALASLMLPQAVLVLLVLPHQLHLLGACLLLALGSSLPAAALRVGLEGLLVPTRQASKTPYLLLAHQHLAVGPSLPVAALRQPLEALVLSAMQDLHALQPIVAHLHLPLDLALLAARLPQPSPSVPAVLPPALPSTALFSALGDLALRAALSLAQQVHRPLMLGPLLQLTAPQLAKQGLLLHAALHQMLASPQTATAPSAALTNLVFRSTRGAMWRLGVRPLMVVPCNQYQPCLSMPMYQLKSCAGKITRSVQCTCIDLHCYTLNFEPQRMPEYAYVSADNSIMIVRFYSCHGV